MKVRNNSSLNDVKSVSFVRTLCSGRKIEQWIEALLSPFSGTPLVIIPGVSLLVKDVEDFIKSIRLAAMIASGELEIE